MFDRLRRGVVVFLSLPTIYLSGFLSHSLFARLIPLWGLQSLVQGFHLDLMIKIGFRAVTRPEMNFQTSSYPFLIKVATWLIVAYG